jgi:putative PEP-CTERM system histidine kinase
MFELSIRGPGVIGYGFAALAFLGFAVHLGIGWRGGAKASILLGAVLASAVWAALNLGFSLTQAPAFWTAQAVFDALRTGGWLLFLAVVLEGSRFGRRLGPLLLLLPAAAWFLYPAAPLEDNAIALPQSRLAFGALLGVAVAGLVLTEQVFRRALEPARWGIKPLCLGLGAGFVFDLYLCADALLFGRIDAGVWAARGFAHALAIPFIALATVRSRDWTIDIALSRGVVFHSTAFLASGIYLLTVATAGYYVRYFGGSWGKTFQVGFIFAALLLLGWLFSSGALRSKLRVFINKNFFSYRYDYRQEWLRFTNLLATRDPNVSNAQRSIQALANLVESPAGALWLHDGEGGYAQAARWNMPTVQAHEAGHGPLPRFLARTGWVVDLQQYAREPSRYPELELPHWMSGLPSAWLVVPLIAQEELIGFVILATPRAAIDVNWEVLDLLKTAARQAGSFLAQMEASEALLEARKFDAFNKMTAFVVHDLKNLVAQLSLLLKNAERHRHNPRFQDDMFSTVKHVGERMNKLLLQLSTGSRGEENLRPIHLARLLERVVAAKRAERHDIELQPSGEEVATLGYEQRFERVIGHLVQNAIDATRDGGDIRVSICAEGPNAVVEVADSGCGMSEEFVRHRLFRPFQTTKGSGMGIGLYEAAQYVKEMGGRIEVDSRPGAGTRLKLMLPLHRDPALEPAREAA